MSEYRFKPSKIWEAVIGTCKKVKDSFLNALLEKVEDKSVGAPDKNVTSDSFPSRRDGLRPGYKRYIEGLR